MDTSRARILLCLAFALVPFASAGTAAAVCGDGLLEGSAEQCDDGNTDTGDCCAADCSFDAQFAACETGNLCIAGGCDGAGTCLTRVRACRSDGSRSADLRDPGSPERQTLKGRIRDTKVNGTLAELGDPTATTEYAVCVRVADLVDPSISTLVYEFPLPVGTGWERTNNGFIYRRPAGASTPLRHARIRASEVDYDSFGFLYSKIRLAAKGPGLDLPGPVSASQYFDLTGGLPVSSFCVVNGLGFAVGVETWEQFLVNDPDHVGWRRNNLGD